MSLLRRILVAACVVLAVGSTTTAGAYTLNQIGNATILNRDVGDPVPTSLDLVSNTLSFSGSPNVGTDVLAGAVWTQNKSLNTGTGVIQTANNTLIYATQAYFYVGVGSYYELHNPSLNYTWVMYYGSDYGYLGYKMYIGGTTVQLSNMPAATRYIRVATYDNSTTPYPSVVCNETVRSSLTLQRVSFSASTSCLSYQIPTDAADAQLVVGSSLGTFQFAVAGLNSRGTIIPPADPITPTPVSIVSAETTLNVSSAGSSYKVSEDPVVMTCIYSLVFVLGLSFVVMIRRKR